MQSQKDVMNTRLFHCLLKLIYKDQLNNIDLSKAVLLELMSRNISDIQSYERLYNCYCTFVKISKVLANIRQLSANLRFDFTLNEKDYKFYKGNSTLE